MLKNNFVLFYFCFGFIVINLFYGYHEDLCNVYWIPNVIWISALCTKSSSGFVYDLDVLIPWYISCGFYDTLRAIS